MKIVSVKINNYKSYYKCPVVHFSDGINIIVGPNNSGKTALLEVLSTNTKQELHLNDETKPYEDLQPDDNIVVEYSIQVEFTKSDRKYIFERKKGSEENYSLGISIYVKINEEKFNVNNDSYLINKFSIKKETNNENFDKFFSSPDIKTQLIGIGRYNYDEVILENEYVYNYIEDYLSKTIFVNIKKWAHLNIKNSSLDINNNLPPVRNPAQNIENVLYFDRKRTSISQYNASTYNNFLSEKLRNEFEKNRVYKFDIHRIVKGELTASDDTDILRTDCQNLSNVLNKLTADIPKWRQYKENIKLIFPLVQDISIDPKLGVLIWTEQSKRKDLAIPLDKCGTGLGQVLSVVYIVSNTIPSKVILIDEPNSFLHPFASRQLISLFKKYPQHQYIISTHSPEIINTANPNKILLLSLKNGITSVQEIDKDKKEEMNLLLNEIGSRLSDVFGYDKILWVEGETEEICLKMIVEDLMGKNTTHIPIVKVKDTGEFGRKQIENIKYIYNRLSAGNALIPPATAFIFDKENLKESEITDLEKLEITFIHYPMYENYLLDIDAITTVLNDNTKGKSKNGEEYDLKKVIISQEVQEWIDNNKNNKIYWWKKEPEVVKLNKWMEHIHAAKLLEDIFKHFLGVEGPEYKKTKHSPALTKYLIEKKPSALNLIKDLLSEFYK